MEKIDMNKAVELTAPHPVTLVCTRTPEGGTNLAAVSWWMFTAFEPPSICFAMAKTAYTGEMTRKNKRAVLAMPSVEIADAVLKCGSVSGRNQDKAKDFGVELKDLPNCDIKIPVQSRLVFDCSLVNTVEVEGDFLHICRVDAMYADAAKTAVFAWDSYTSIRPLP